MTIDKLKLDGGAITVDYSGLAESFRISTMDEAKASLYQAAADVAILARVALGLVTERAGFHTIAFSNGDKPGSRVILTIPTLAGDPAKLACPKIDATTVKDFETGAVIKDHPQNLYNDAVQHLLEETKDFVMGKRLQMALPFDQSPDERRIMKEGEELIKAGTKIIEFNARA